MISVTMAIVAHNAGPHIQRAIRSCLDQHVARIPIEVLVVNDGSLDDTGIKASSYRDSITLLEIDRNVGVGAASALAVDTASGDYFMRVDADDYVSRFLVQFSLEILRPNPHFTFVFPDYLIVDDNDAPVEIRQISSIERLLRHGAGMLFDISAVRAAGNYSRELRNGEDFDLLARLFENGAQAFRLPSPLYRYTTGADSLTASADREATISALEEKYEGFRRWSSQVRW